MIKMKYMPRPYALLFALLFLTPSWLRAQSTTGATPDTVWDGVYTTVQAGRGESAYSAQCSRCHKDDLSGYRNVLVGDRFMEDWREDRLESFFTTLKNTMPRNAPASLTDREYLDIVAYVLQVNEFPAGTNELTTDKLAGIRIEAKQGAQAVPDYALVEVVGCLVQSSDAEWMLTNATEPIRTRAPGDSPAGELKTVGMKPAGNHPFHLLDATVIRVGPPGTKLPRDQKVEAKGFLMRKQGGDSINLTSLQPVGSACAP
jgi:mono/diheme cytochrome c family protein